MSTHERIRWLTLTAVLLAITLAVQMIGLPQPITGPAVNAMLILSAAFAGPISGIIIGLLTPLIAFMRGILAAPLAPMIPFIMIGNGTLVLLFWLGCRLIKNLMGSVAGIVTGSVIKFLILSAAVNLIVSVPEPVAQAMQLPQLFNALIGGVIALIVERAIKAALNSRN
ncbi:ECF transporter S component [Mahella australiensis]|uniref:ECF transporter S component n=1 Tax=Mahella australiensis (strain DSM 15567 / CIP 107919 / 50-1 BON) TaxID=697281 RepID=F3ZY62_MAHA5|nr:ECF transporter S component [Mahella australiensis]AEE97758.1 hypothetical protein Mahau_2618 [Mahella australiensis 50-1 BON]